MCEDTTAAQRLFLPMYYRRSPRVVHDLETAEILSGLVRHSNVYNSAAFLADSPGFNGWIINVGCGARSGHKSLSLVGALYQKGFSVFILDSEDNLILARTIIEATDRYRQWAVHGQQGDSGVGMTAWDVSENASSSSPDVPMGVTNGSVVVSADVIQRLPDPLRLVRTLKDLVDQGARAVVLSTPDRELSFPDSESAPHEEIAQLWEAQELWALLACSGLPHVTWRHTEDSEESSSSESVEQGSPPKTVLCVSSVLASLSMLPDHIPNFTAGDAKRGEGAGDSTPSRQPRTAVPVGKCEFSGCPSDKPLLHIIVIHRNRGASLHRLVRSIAADLQWSGTTLPWTCVCLVISDFDEVVKGVPVPVVLMDWPYSRVVIRIDGSFIKARGHELAIQHGVSTTGADRDRSLLLFMDADMFLHPGVINAAVKNTVKDELMYAPIVYRTAPFTTKHDGFWEPYGTGILAFYVTELAKFSKPNHLPMADKTDWGVEDWALLWELVQFAKLRVVRPCSMELWHIFHPHASAWGTSLDGQVEGHSETGLWAPVHYMQDRSWVLPMVDAGPGLQKRIDARDRPFCKGNWLSNLDLWPKICSTFQSLHNLTQDPIQAC